MNISANIHDITSIRFSEPLLIESTGSYYRNIIIQTGSGTVDIAVYSQDAAPLNLDTDTPEFAALKAERDELQMRLDEIQYQSFSEKLEALDALVAKEMQR